MIPDEFKQAWRTQTSQTRLMVDGELLLTELRTHQRHFAAIIFWRDVREVGISLLLVPVWCYLGFRFSLPWTWYLVVPALLWVAGFMLVDRMRHKRQPPGPGEPLRQCAENLLAQVDHQIWLLRNIFWWYLLPCALAMLPFIGEVTWKERSGGWLTALVVAFAVAFEVIVLSALYWLNQFAVRAELGPRRQELEALLMSLKDETPAAS
jgi:hypothetical protein